MSFRPYRGRRKAPLSLPHQANLILGSFNSHILSYRDDARLFKQSLDVEPFYECWAGKRLIEKFMAIGCTREEAKHRIKLYWDTLD